MRTRMIGAPALARLLGPEVVGPRADRDGDPAATTAGGAKYRRLTDALRVLVLDGRLALDVALPGERDLAGALGVSRTTVAAAYAALRDEGWLRSRPGARSTTTIPGGARGTAAAPPPGPLTDPGTTLDLAYAAPGAVEGGVHEAYAAALAELPAHLPGHGYERVGLEGLRAAVADRYAARGLPTRPAQILVTSGAQHAITLLLGLCCAPGDRVAIDHPSYPHAFDAIRHAGCATVPVAVGEDGWDLEGWRAALRQTAPRLAYVIADFHNPTGRCMTAEEREAIVAAAAASRTLLVVDEVMAELRLDGDGGEPGPPPVAAFDRADGVVTVGSTSKAFWGGLRIGWVRASEELVGRLAATRTRTDLGTPVLEQLAAAHLLRDAGTILDRRRAALRRGRDALVAGLADRLPAWDVTAPAGGLACWVGLPGPTSTALAAAAGRHGLRLAAGPRFGLDGAFERRLRVPFTLPPDDLAEAVERLARADADAGASAGHEAAPVAAVA